MQVPIPVSLQAVDLAGNAGAPVIVTVTNADPKRQVLLENLALAPPAGSLTRTGVVSVAGSIRGDVGPFTVTFMIDGVAESQIAGLSSGEAFRHAIGLPGDGTRSFSVRGRDALGNEVVTTVGSVTVDRTPPAPPVLLTPDPVVTNQPVVTLRGIADRAGPSPGPGQLPASLILGPAGGLYTPAQPQSIADPGGRFETALDVSRLADGSYTFRITGFDAAGNPAGPVSIALRARGGPKPAPGAADISRALALTLPRPMRRLLRMPGSVAGNTGPRGR
jgi:hypothetical protein